MKLRNDKYKVRFGLRWSCDYILRQATSWSEAHEESVSWGEDATAVPCDGPAKLDGVKNLTQDNFPNIQIEIVWGEEETNEQDQK